jgi:hydroxyacylglutathione hydrolase
MIHNGNIQEKTIAEALALGPHALWVDVRQDIERKEGFIENSIHMPLDRLSDEWDSLPLDRPIIIYCQRGSRSAHACDFLEKMGLDNIYNLKSGFLGWLKEKKDNEGK